MAGLSGRWVLPGPGRTGGIGAGARAGRRASRSPAGRSKAGVPRSHWLPAHSPCWPCGRSPRRLWSDAPARALSEFDRTLLYGLVLVLTGSVAARVGDLSMLLRWTAAAFAAIALAGLLTRLLPDTFPISSGFLPERVSFPLTYWNAMGIACALGALLAVHLTASGRERTVDPCRRGRAAAADRGHALPDLLARRDLGAAARLRALRAARAAARAADRAAGGGHPGGDRGQGRLRRRAARARRLRHLRGRRRARAVTSSSSCSPVPSAPRRCGRRRCRWTGGWRRSRSRRTTGASCASRSSGGLVIALLLGALAADAPRRLADARATFSEGRYMDYSADLRTRLTSAVDNGRIDNWRVALDGFDTLAAARHRRRHVPAHLGRATARRRRSRSTTGTRSTWRRCRSSGSSGSCCCWSRSATLLVGGAARLGGPERHAHGAVRRRRRDAAGCTRRSTGTGRCPRCSCGSSARAGVVLAARDGAAGRARAHAADRRRAGRARAGDHAGAVRALAGRAGPRR